VNPKGRATAKANPSKKQSNSQNRPPLANKAHQKTSKSHQKNKLEITQTATTVATTTPMTDAALAVEEKEKREKALRNLRKKLRQIEQLEATSTLYPDEDQLKKIQKKPEIIAEISRLEKL
jgi:hypothetical protein